MQRAASLHGYSVQIVPDLVFDQMDLSSAEGIGGDVQCKWIALSPLLKTVER